MRTGDRRVEWSVPMRLTDKKQETIRRLAATHFGPDARVWLFGSRTDDRLHGGDVDLLIETSLDTPAAFDARLHFEAGLVLALGERKIDVLVRPFGRSLTPFEAEALRHGLAP